MIAQKQNPVPSRWKGTGFCRVGTRSALAEQGLFFLEDAHKNSEENNNGDGAKYRQPDIHDALKDSLPFDVFRQHFHTSIFCYVTICLQDK